MRGLCSWGDQYLATSSRDKSVKIWRVPQAPSESPDNVTTLLGHTNFVGPLVLIPSDSKPSTAAGGTLVSGGFDGRILAWDSEMQKPMQELKVSYPKVQSNY